MQEREEQVEETANRYAHRVGMRRRRARSHVPSKRLKAAHRKARSNLSLREFAKGHPDGEAWLKNKRS